MIIALKLSLVELPGSYAEMGEALGMSASEVHAGVRRLVEARLIDPESRRARGEVFLNFLVHLLEINLLYKVISKQAL